jgi:hypothetical protein
VTEKAKGISQVNFAVVVLRRAIVALRRAVNNEAANFTPAIWEHSLSVYACDSCRAPSHDLVQ